jgi:hypothetical protein
VEVAIREELNFELPRYEPGVAPATNRKCY